MGDYSAFDLRVRIEQSLRIDPKPKPRIYAQIYEPAEIASLHYWLELVFSAEIAIPSLVLYSPLVVIGAMLIPPLIGLLLAEGLALAASDFYLGVKSVVNVLACEHGKSSRLRRGHRMARTIVRAPTAEILSWTQPNLLDLGIAIFSVLTGSVVVCRGGGGGGVTALPARPGFKQQSRVSYWAFNNA
ncbi:MAG: hypothetical protein ABI806_12750 [Candidatus Solibacter sp.]